MLKQAKVYGACEEPIFEEEYKEKVEILKIKLQIGTEETTINC